MLEITHKVIHLQSFEKYSKNTEQKDIIVISVSKKYRNILFSQKCIQDLGMNGKFVRLFFEPTKKIIAWKIKDSITIGKEDRNWRIIKVRKNGSALITIVPIIKAFNGSLRDDSYTNLEVKKNVSPASTGLDSGETFYYVELKDKERDLSKVHLPH